MTFKTIKETKKMKDSPYKLGYESALEKVLELIDNRIKLLLNGELKEIFKACISELKELKARIEGKCSSTNRSEKNGSV